MPGSMNSIDRMGRCYATCPSLQSDSSYLAPIFKKDKTS